MAKAKQVVSKGKPRNVQASTSQATDSVDEVKSTGRSFAKVPLYEGSALKNNLDDVAKQV